MFDSFSAFGSLVQTPWGPRKSGMPDSVEIPAPVSATIRAELSTQLRIVSVSLLIFLVHTPAQPLLNLRQFAAIVDGVRLHIFTIIYFKAVFVEEPHLSTSYGDRQNFIVLTVGDQPVALIHVRIHFP